MYEKLVAKIYQLKENSEDYSFRLHKYDEKLCQPFILVIVSPLMKRAHQMVANSKDLVFEHGGIQLKSFHDSDAQCLWYSSLRDKL